MVADENAEEWANKFRQWIINRPNSPAGNVLSKSSFESDPERNYSLRNTDPDGWKTFLQAEGQEFGINLGWTTAADEETEVERGLWFFTHEEGEGPVGYGQTIALAFGADDSWLYYSHREWGIDLDWSYEPVFEWKILGGTPGVPVRTKDRVAILNTSATSEDFENGEPLIRFDRAVGGDIGWPSSTNFVKDIGWTEVAAVAIGFLLAGNKKENEDDDEYPQATA